MYRWKMPRGKILAASSLKHEGAMTLISNGSVALLKYKLNNVCDPKGIRKPRWGGAQIAE